MLFILVAPAHAQLDSGGGTREGNGVRVRDSLGQPLAGLAAGAGIRASSGLLFGISIPTPVDLLRFHIQAGNDGVRLAWTASADEGIAWFQVERAAGQLGDTGPVFHPLGAVLQGPGPHEFLDSEPVRPVSLYRLVARLRDGSSEVLGPWEVAVLDGAPVRPFSFAARPNPFRGALTLAFSLDAESPVRWRLLDLQGRRLAVGDLGRLGAGAHAVAYTPPADLAHGMYFLEVEAGEHREVQKVVKLP